MWKEGENLAVWKLLGDLRGPGSRSISAVEDSPDGPHIWKHQAVVECPVEDVVLHREPLLFLLSAVSSFSPCSYRRRPDYLVYRDKIDAVLGGISLILSLVYGDGL